MATAAVQALHAYPHFPVGLPHNPVGSELLQRFALAARQLDVSSALQQISTQPMLDLLIAWRQLFFPLFL